MNLDEINALRSPQQRPPGVSFADYNRMCYTAGVAETLSKSAWDSLPLMKGMPEDDVSEKGGYAYKGMKLDLEKMTMCPKGMTYKTYMSACKAHGCSPMSKADFEELDEEEVDMEKAEDDIEDDMEADEEEAEAAGEDIDAEDADDEEDEDDVDVEKGLRTSALLKAIAAYEVTSDALDTPTSQSREAFLQARLDADTISKSERIELGRIWSGQMEDDFVGEESMQKSLVDTLQEDDNASQLVDASDFLRTLVKGVDTRMGDVLGSITRDGRATRELMKAQGSLVKSLAAHTAKQDKIIKAMARRLEVVEHAPAPRRAVKARRGDVSRRSLSKSVYGGTNGDTLSKSEVTGGLRALLMHAVDNGDNAAVQRITQATALYEQTGSIPSNIMEAVRQVS